MTWLLSLFLALWNPPTAHEVETFRATAPDYLTAESARQHMVAARAAGAVHRVPVEVLLSVAWHESRYRPTERTPEPGGRVSCGVMTPTPQARCSPVELTRVGGYDAGAAHLALWLSLCRGGMRCALLAYAGGFTLVRACANRDDGTCAFPDVILQRARRIRNATKEL
jgi:hypothetical protein